MPSKQKTSCAGCAHEKCTAHEEPCHSCTNWRNWSPLTFKGRCEEGPLYDPKKTLVHQTCETCGKYGNYSDTRCNLKPDECQWEPVAPVPDTAKELADAHWAYVKDVLTTHCSPEAKAFIGEIGFHYKTAFVHGYKHGKEDK